MPSSMRLTQLLAAFALAPLSSCALFGITDKVDVDHPMQSLESGIQFREILMGQGPPVESGQAVTIDYVGFLADGSTFDSSIDRGVPMEFIMGNAPLTGWNHGILGMRAGGRRHLSLPPEFAYGEAGIEGLIPPNESLVFEIWLLEIRADE